MKSHQLYLLSGLTLTILLQSCTPMRFYHEDAQYFTEIPLKDQKQEFTKIYFPDDLKPDRPYIEAGVVRVIISGNKRTQQLAELLRAKAQRLGLDAVIAGERMREGSRGANVGEALALGAVDGMVNAVLGQEGDGSTVDGFETYAYSVLEGIGIKYLDNIHNIEKSVKSEKVYFASKPDELLYHKEFFLNGETKSIDFDKQLAIYTHDNFVEAFSLHHLVKQQANWAYREYENEVIKREYYKTRDWKLKNCRFIYDVTRGNSLKKIVVRYPGQEKKDVIKLFGKLGVTERKEIYQNGILTHKEKLLYDDKDRLTTRKIFKIENDEETLWLIAKYDYYNNTELKKYLDKAAKPTLDN